MQPVTRTGGTALLDLSDKGSYPARAIAIDRRDVVSAGAIAEQVVLVGLEGHTNDSVIAL